MTDVRAYMRKCHERGHEPPASGNCVECRRHTSQVWQRSLDPERKAGYSRRHKYGLEPEHFDAMVVAQSGRCGICEDPLVDRICVDHNHRTGQVRGLLCRNCNNGLGHFRDDNDRLRSAIKYLETYEEDKDAR